MNLVAKLFAWKALWQLVLAEDIATFFSVFTGTATAIGNQISSGKVNYLGISLLLEAVVAALTYKIGDLAEPHFYHSVTLGFWSSRFFSQRHSINALCFDFSQRVPSQLL